jgi:hypothetical protein
MRLDQDSMRPVATTMQADDGSWAEVALGSDDEGRRVVRGSSADLWASVERAYTLWHELGEPGWESFGLTVTDAQQRIWFDSPQGAHTWTLADPTVFRRGV